VQEIQIQQQMDLKLSEFSRHVDDVNVDFKENIMKKVEMIKLKDTSELQLKVDELKHDEFLSAERLNRDYLKGEQQERRILDKTKQKQQLMMRVVAQWETNKKVRSVFNAWKQRMQTKQKELSQGEYCHAFFLQGLKQRSFKGFKLYAQVAGNRQYERRVKDRINIDVRTRVEERQNEREFLVAMIKELEEQLRIELRKKTILKAQCDQAYLRGVSAISMEALKMS